METLRSLLADSNSDCESLLIWASSQLILEISWVTAEPYVTVGFNNGLLGHPWRLDDLELPELEPPHMDYANQQAGLLWWNSTSDLRRRFSFNWGACLYAGANYTSWRIHTDKNMTDNSARLRVVRSGSALPTVPKVGAFRQPWKPCPKNQCESSKPKLILKTFALGVFFISKFQSWDSRSVFLGLFMCRLWCGSGVKGTPTARAHFTRLMRMIWDQYTYH